jgi:predicted phosphodiesterase
MKPIRSSLRLLLAGVLMLGFSATAQNPPVLSPASPIIAHGPLLLNPSSDGADVVWFTDRPCVAWVEYGAGGDFKTFPQFGGLIKIARTVRHGLVEAGSSVHRVRIEGVKPGTRIRYRVASKEILQFEPYEVIFGATVLGEIGEFQTLDPARTEFEFLVFQDIHGDAAKLETLLSKAASPAPDFVFFNGDTLSDLGSEDGIFRGFIDPASRLFAGRIPFFFVRGNHETRGRLARRLADYFPPRDGRYYYSFDQGPVHFVVLDSGEDKPDDSPVYAGLTVFDRYREEQAAWLKSEIKTPAFKKAAFRIVVVHFPLFGTGYGVEHATRLWGPLLNEGGVDVVLSGHYHKLVKFEPTAEKNTFPVLGGPVDGVMKALVRPNQISIQIIDIKGLIVDSVNIRAKTGNPEQEGSPSR